MNDGVRPAGGGPWRRGDATATGRAYFEGAVCSGAGLSPRAAKSPDRAKKNACGQPSLAPWVLSDYPNDRSMLDDERTPPRGVLAALPIFPLPNAVLLPGMVLPLNVFEPRYLELVDHALENGRHIGVPLLRPGFEQCYEKRPELEPVFGVGRLLSHQCLPDGRRFIRLEGVRRVRLLEELDTDTSFRQVEVELLPEDPPRDGHQLEVLKAQLERIAGTLRSDDGQLVASVLRIADTRLVVYAIAAIVPTLGLMPDLTPLGERSSLLELQQRCLEAESADERVQTLLECSALICDELSESGSFPRTMLN
jgi:uncharacterized protein